MEKLEKQNILFRLLSQPKSGKRIVCGISIPKGIREALGWQPGDSLELNCITNDTAPAQNHIVVKRTPPTEYVQE